MSEYADYSDNMNGTNYSMADMLNFTGDVCDHPQHVMDHRDLTQIPWVSVTMAIIYLCVATLALLGNILVIWTVWRDAHMHTVTNYYIVNLAVSDLLVAAIVMPLKVGLLSNGKTYDSFCCYFYIEIQIRFYR